LKKETNIFWIVTYPLILPICAIAPWWAFAKFILKLEMSEYKIFGYFIFLLFFTVGIAITIWNRKIKEPKKEILMERIATGYGKAMAFSVGLQFLLIIIVGILFFLKL
jgi:hypothetical protein